MALRERMQTVVIDEQQVGLIYKYFCSNNCYNSFADKHAEQIIKIEPRHEPLETRIDDPKKTEHSHYYSSGHVHKWTTTEIKKIDTAEQ